MSNPYSFLLKEYISQSRLSLSEIENELRKRDFKKNKVYLSNLQNGKLPPPPYVVSKAICDIVGGDPIRLGLTGTIMEICQQGLFSFMDTSQEEFTHVIIDTVTTMIAVLFDINKEQLSIRIKDIFTELGYEISKEDCLNIFAYNTIKDIAEESIKTQPIKEIIVDFFNEISSDNVLETFVDHPSDEDAPLTPDEAEYLKECLSIYRKLKLKPQKHIQ